jgi:hypothetical protein
MKTMRNLLYRSWIPLALVICLAPVARPQSDQQGQQQNQQQGQQADQSTDQSEQPIPAYHSPLAGISGGGQSQEQSSTDLQPDTQPLSGAQELGFGVAYPEHSYWQPGFNVFTTIDSNPLGLTAGWGTYTNFFGSLEVRRISARNNLTMDYVGGGAVSTNSGIGNSTFQQVQFGDQIFLRRTTISFLDSASYLPEAGYGYAELGGLSLPGTGSLGLGNSLALEPSILGSRNQQIMNAFITQVNTHLTPRSSVTFFGGYSLLHFFGGDYLDFKEPMFQAGYNYEVSPRNTIAILYNFNDFQYSGTSQSVQGNSVNLNNGSSQSVQANSVNVSFARRVTGRMAFQVAAGPQIIDSQLPASSAIVGSSEVATSGRELTWNLTSNFTYALERGALDLSYTHGVSGGSGVLAGATGDFVTGSVTRALSRAVDGGLEFGYARNHSLNGSYDYLASSSTAYDYNYWFGGANVSRQLGRSLTLTMSYELQHQTSNSSLGIGNSSGTFVRHVISVGVSWRAHPFAF